ncbi:MAG: FliM/FliN family flagellar motor switch protein [Parvularculaceae bacterium]
MTEPALFSHETSDPNEEVVWAERSAVSDLLGFDLCVEGVDRSGLAALVNSALVAHRRLPMLDIIFDRAARRFATTIRQLTNADADSVLDNVTSIRFGDFLQSQSGQGVVGVIKASSLGGPLLVAAEPQFVHHAVDLLLGGRRGAAHDQGRALTAIELSILQRVLRAITADLNEAFAAVADPGLMLERMETAPRFAAIVQETSVCVIGKFKILLEDRGSRLTVVAPFASLEPIEEELRRSFTPGSGAAEESWRRRLAGGLRSATFDVAAVLGDRVLRLADARKLCAGDVLTFGDSRNPRVELRIGASAIASGRVGKHGDRVAVKLDAGVEREAAALAAEASS